MTEAVNLISTVGFPIACTIAMWYLLEKERESHKEESKQLTDAISNNTRIMERILDALHNLPIDIKED